MEAKNRTEVDDEIADLWITKMTIFLSTGLSPEGMSPDEHKRLAFWSRNFCLLKETLYHKGADDIWQCAVQQFEKATVLREAHYGVVGRHYASDTTAQKI